jgi:O-antigen ligase
MRQLLLRLRPADASQWVFLGFVGALLLGGALVGVRHQSGLLLLALALPAAVLVATRWQWLYYGLFLTLAFSREMALGGQKMDVPSEPLMLALLACAPLALLFGRGGLHQLAPREWRHPLLLIPLMLLVWSALDTYFSVDKVKSLKYVLAKCWYLAPFLLGSLLVLRRPADFWRLAACYVGGVVVSLLWVLPRHASIGFSFAKTNWAIQPFYVNHVVYATTLALLLPFVGGLAARATTPARRRLWLGAALLLLFGLITSYTRASWLSLPVAALFYWVIRLRLMRVVLLVTALATAGAATYFVSGENFMRFRPDYEKTIWHGSNLVAHLESTYKFQDVSGMERVYRWVAAARMIADKPLTGSGPSTFNPTYKRYTVSSFRTYVSANHEGSTVHNYFLLQLAEQGVPAFLLFCILIGTALLTAERLYHATRQQPEVHRIVLVVSLSFIIILSHLFLNELIENDKVGSIFFVALAMLIRCGTWLEEAQAAEASAARKLAGQA